MQRLRRLASRRSARWEARRFVVEGPKLLAEALQAGAAVDTVFVDAAAATGEHRALAARAAQGGAHLYEVQADVLDRACDAVTPQPLAAIVAMMHVAVDDLPAGGLTVVAVGLQDPGNAGTVLRSASAAGGSAVVFCTGAVDLYSPKTVRASAGAVFHLPIAADVDAAWALERLGSRGFRRIGTVVRGGRDYDQADWSGPVALVLGSESRGLPAQLDLLLDERVTIPMRPPVESLNVAMAATVICFESARQRGRPGSGARGAA